MGSLLEQLIVCAVLTSGVVFCQNVPLSFPPVRGGTGNFNCPQERGQFQSPGECNRFYQCDGGVATLINCPQGFIFNPQVGYCDWPYRVPNANCPEAFSNLKAQVSEVCRNNPGNPNEAFITGHPEICNAFFMCSTSFIFPPCTFCGEGMYFSVESRGCRDYLSLGLDINAVCQGRQFVPHSEKVMRQLDGSCWPYTQNPYQPLIDAIRAGNWSRPNPSIPRQG